MSLPALTPEFRELVAQLCDDELTPEQAQRLEAIATSDPEALQYYLLYLDLHGTMRRYATSRVHAAPTEELDCAEIDGPAGTSVGLPTDTSFYTLRISKFSILGTLAVACFVAIGVSALQSLKPPGQGPLDWTASSPGRVSSVRLDSGITTLALDKVGTVTVEGPADFELLGPHRARLNRGRIKMCVTQAMGRGFVVETPDGEVTDLGTEFGIDVSEGRKTGLVVFQGAVDLRTAEKLHSRIGSPRRLVGGEAVAFDKQGELHRLMSIYTADKGTFTQPGDMTANEQESVFAEVSDNRRASESLNFYEIVKHGLREDARSYVDRNYEWNSVGTTGLPPYLGGADYVKTFNQDQWLRDLEIRVKLRRPAKLYVLFDSRLEVPKWLNTKFRKTGDKIGLDMGPRGKAKVQLGSGAGVSIDLEFTVWEMTVSEPRTVRLGGNQKSKRTLRDPAMYGIAAVPLEETDPGRIAAEGSSTNSIP